MWLESPGLFVLDFRVRYSQHRSKVLPLMNPIFIITTKLWILAVEQSIIFFVRVSPVPSSCWSVAVVMIEHSGLECLLNIVNECHSQIQDYELIYSTFLVLNSLIKSEAQDERAKNKACFVNICCVRNITTSQSKGDCDHIADLQSTARLKRPQHRVVNATEAAILISIFISPQSLESKRPLSFI